VNDKSVDYVVNAYANEHFPNWPKQRVKSTKSILKRWLDAVGRKTIASTIQPSDVLSFLKPDWSRTSRHTYIRAIKAVFLWALDEELIVGKNPLKRLRGVGTEQRQVVVDPKQARHILDHLRQTREPIAPLAEFIHLTGCRPSEACRLEVAHVDLENRMVRMTGKTTWKTGLDRIITLSPRAITFLAEQIRGKSGHVFLNSEGQPWNHNSTGIAMRRIRRDLGLDRNCCLEAFRHGYATDAAMIHPPAMVAELIGNSPSATERYYLHLRSRRRPIEVAAAKVRK
jgi:integrase